MKGGLKTVRELNRKEVFEAVRRALAEDIGRGDITTAAVFPKPETVRAEIIAKEPGVIAGISVSMAAFKLLNPKIKFMPLIQDGKTFGANAVISFVEGDVRSILSAERSALNFLSRLSGIATLTSQFVNKIRPYKTKIMDTRKTTPGLRLLEKYAVTAGGGYNHRLGLHDQVLIKDNHLKAVDYDWAVLCHTIRKYKKRCVKTEVEISNLKELKEAIKLTPDIIMLDNMGIKEIKAAVKLLRSLRSDIKLEVSGGVSLNNVRKIAATGVDMISVGAITHSAKPIDFSLEIIK
ncbi:MAG: carboxylating nicotinate-nucleotide diphosphorylase [Candidatus Omnitrophota bacterium]|nr:carboxylating nicotinate-nucleotide diphosphorylase [Candidatus Omnitrophota bacterium]